jgi:RES domain-containing protein
MMALDALRAALESAPVRCLRTTLVRCVALSPLTEGSAPDYLFTSGRPNRYNPANVPCVYFSEAERTARAEYGRRFGHGSGALQPLGTYFAEVNLAKVLDLANEQTREALQLEPRDLSVAWQLARKPTRTQVLGLAVSKQAAIAAICFPSDGARAAGFAGFNVVIFRNCVHPPDSVRILGPTRKPLQKWP